jgi:hypothetical protein
LINKQAGRQQEYVEQLFRGISSTTQHHVAQGILDDACCCVLFAWHPVVELGERSKAGISL